MCVVYFNIIKINDYNDYEYFISLYFIMNVLR